ncbi:hypothetical protein ABIC33_000878 [Variovorax sp. 1140]|uniref:hypothetical protein n=1 Tax=Variovorax atrisoli TaxID=3394203 RepID=UPI003392ECAF
MTTAEAQRMPRFLMLAMHAAISFVSQKKKTKTQTQAIFEVRAKCDAALNSLLHYK